MKNSLLNRLSAFMLAALLCLSLTGCAGKNVSEDSSSAGDNTIEESADSGKNDVWVALSMNVDTLDLVMTTSVGGRQVALGTVNLFRSCAKAMRCPKMSLPLHSICAKVCCSMTAVK